MVSTAISSGSRYCDRLNKTITHVLQAGYASGATPRGATNPYTGVVVTVVRQTRPFNVANRLGEGPRYIPIKVVQ